MTHDEATAEVDRRRISDPGCSWIATQSAGEWKVVRIGLPPTPRPTGTATKPPPVAPQDDPQSDLQRQIHTLGPGF